MLLVISTLLITIILLVYKFLSWNYNYWQKRDVPHLPGKVPYGNISDVVFNKKNMGELYQEIYNMFPGEPVCGFFKLRQPILLLRDPELIKAVLVKEFNNFQENDFHFNEKTDPLLAINPFALSGERWKNTRAILTPVQSPSRVKTMIPCSIGVCNKMIDFLSENVGKEFEMTELMGHFTADTMGAWVLGLEVNSFRDPNSEYRQAASNMFGGDFKSNLAMKLAFYSPTLCDLIGFSMFKKSFVSYFSGLVSSLISDHKAADNPRCDIIQLLLDRFKDAEAKGKSSAMTEQEIMGHTLTFLSEGYLSSSITLSHILFELAKHQDVQEKAREEILLLASNINEMTYEKLQKLNYLNAVIDESLRLHPFVPLMAKVCTKNTVLPVGKKELELSEGMAVIVPVLAIHKDPEIYPNPEVFDPERFSDESRMQRDKILYLGFSEGPRMCLGVRIAQINLMLALSSLLLNFRLLPSDKTKDVVIDPASSFMLFPKGGVWIKLEKL